MRLSRDDAGELARLEAAQTAKDSAEEVLHPPGSTPRFTDARRSCKQAWDDEQHRRLPRRRARHRPARATPAWASSPAPPARRSTRACARRRSPPRSTSAPRCARSAGESPLIVTSTVRDDAYQRLLVARNREATRNYSLHTTGWAFDIARRYRSKAQALAFQFVLDRLQVLDAIAWVREPGAIHVTAAPEGKALLPLLKRVQPGG